MCAFFVLSYKVDCYEQRQTTVDKRHRVRRSEGDGFVGSAICRNRFTYYQLLLLVLLLLVIKFARTITFLILNTHVL